MMENTKILLTIIPLDESIRTDTLNQFDNLSPDQKFTIQRYCREVFYWLIDLEINYRINQKMNESKGSPALINLHDEIEKEVYQEFQQKIMDASDVRNIETIRKQLTHMVERSKDKLPPLRVPNRS